MFFLLELDAFTGVSAAYSKSNTKIKIISKNE
jgi:hypothetical protein